MEEDLRLEQQNKEYLKRQKEEMEKIQNSSIIKYIKKIIKSKDKHYV